MRYRQIFGALVIVLVTTAVFAQETTSSEDAAVQAYRQGSFSRAVSLYTQALSETEDPEHQARLHVNIAWTLFALGRTDEVNTHLNAALLKYPEFVLISDYYTREFMDLFEAARRYAVEGGGAPEGPAPDLEATLSSIEARIESEGDLEGALADVDRLLDFYPLDGRLVPIKVQVLTMLGRTSDAQDLARGRTGAYSGSFSERMSIPDLILRANGQLERGDPDTALELLREAVARQPNNVAALELMAEAAQAGQKWQEAEFALKSALSLQPENLGLNLHLGDVYLAMGEKSAARDIFREITQDFPRSDRAWAALGLLDAQLGNTDNAVNELSKALEENPLLPEVQLAYGELILARGEAGPALEAFRSAANLLQDDARVEARIGQALLALERSEEALNSLRLGVAGGFDPADVQRSLSLALILAGDLAEGERVLDGVGPGSRGDGEILKTLAQLERGENDVAFATIEQIAKDRSGEPAILNLLAATLYRMERYSDAKSILEQAHDLAPDDTVIEGNLTDAAAAVTAVALQENARESQPLPSK